MALHVKFTSDPTLSKGDYTFSDLHLDLALIRANEKEDKSYPYNSAKGNELQIDKDLAAVSNSLRNLFFTKKGQRFLQPEFGVELDTFLFEAITELNARVIGETIQNAIAEWEPRVFLRKLRIHPDPDNNEYQISVIFSVPALEQPETTYNFSLP